MDIIVTEVEIEINPTASNKILYKMISLLTEDIINNLGKSRIILEMLNTFPKPEHIICSLDANVNAILSHRNRG